VVVRAGHGGVGGRDEEDAALGGGEIEDVRLGMAGTMVTRSGATGQLGAHLLVSRVGELDDVGDGVSWVESVDDSLRVVEADDVHRTNSALTRGVQPRLGTACHAWGLTIMVQYFDAIPDSLAAWMATQKVFWVATAPLTPDGHINLSPKGVEGTFNIVHSNRVWYEDLTGSGKYTSSALPTYHNSIHRHRDRRTCPREREDNHPLQCFRGPPQDRSTLRQR